MNHQAILQDRQGSRWLRFDGLRDTVVAGEVSMVIPKLEEVEAKVEERGWYAVGLISYEAAPAFDPALVVRPATEVPLLWFALFESVEALIDPRAERPDLIDFGSVERARLKEALDELPDREARIIRLRFGLGESDTVLTLRQIAKEMELSRERVRQLEHKGLEALRRALGEKPRRGKRT